MVLVWNDCVFGAVKRQYSSFSSADVGERGDLFEEFDFLVNFSTHERVKRVQRVFDFCQLQVGGSEVIDHASHEPLIGGFGGKSSEQQGEMSTSGVANRCDTLGIDPIVVPASSQLANTSIGTFDS